MFDMARVVGSLEKGKVYLPSKGAKLNEGPETYRRDLVYKWIRSKSTKDIKEIVELENMFSLLKGTTDEIIYKKFVIGDKKFNKEDLAYFKLLKEVLVDLHKLKHGEKRFNVNVGYKDIQEMMFGKEDANNK